ncbi:MAG: hypothetical protein NTU97_00625 [Candidatus Magasanikbacteria bacterium]|nr:hypothetical protein [Candidatus Magasanikbacteria bacterium]
MHGVNEYKKGSKMTNPGILFLGLFFGFFLSLFLVHSSSAINQQISFQGKLTDATGNLVTDGVHYLKFSLYDTASIGTCQYTAAGSCGSVTTTPVTVTGGIFSVNLGDTDSGINALPATLFNADALYLGLTVCSGPNTGCDTEMTPRKRVTASPYAFNSKKLDGVGINTVSSSLYLPVSDAVGNFNFNSVTSTGLLSVKYSNNDTLQQWLDGSGNVIGSFATSTGSVILPAVGTNGNNYSYIQNAVFSLGDSSHSGALKLNGTAADAGGSVLFTYPGSSLIKTYLDGNGLVVGGDDTTSTFGGIEIIHASTLSNPSGLFHVGGDGSVSTSGTLSVFGNLSRINNVPYSWTGSQGGANTFLRNDGSGSLTWATVVGGSGTNDWGRFGTTYGALALMTSSTYPVWFDGAVYTSSSVKIAGGSKSYLDIGGDGNGLGQLYIQASSTTAVPLLIRANANQGSNTAITSWQDGLGRTMMQFTSSSNNGWELNIGNNNGGLGGQVRLTDPTDNFSLFSSNRFALNRSNAGLYDQGVFNIDYLGNTSVSGTLSVFGNLSRINNVPYSWTGSQGGANTFLRNDGSGSLTWATVVGGSGTNDWGRFGTTYGALALMTSSTYPVWFDGAVYSSSSLYVGGGNSLSGLSITAGSNNDGDKLLSILDHGVFFSYLFWKWRAKGYCFKFRK